MSECVCVHRSQVLCVCNFGVLTGWFTHSLWAVRRAGSGVGMSGDEQCNNGKRAKSGSPCKNEELAYDMLAFCVLAISGLFSEV